MRDPASDLTDMESRRRRLRGEMQEVREEIADVQRLEREASEFQVEAREQEARLSKHADHRHGPRRIARRLVPRGHGPALAGRYQAGACKLATVVDLAPTDGNASWM